MILRQCLKKVHAHSICKVKYIVYDSKKRSDDLVYLLFKKRKR